MPEQHVLGITYYVPTTHVGTWTPGRFDTRLWSPLYKSSTYVFINRTCFSLQTLVFSSATTLKDLEILRDVWEIHQLGVISCGLKHLALPSSRGPLVRFDEGSAWKTTCCYQSCLWGHLR